MVRVTNTPATHWRRKGLKKQAKGGYGSKHKLLKTVKEHVMRSLAYAYIGRKQRKRDFRSKIWIPRLNAELRSKHGLSYSRFINLLVKAQIKLNRKRLSEMALNEPQSFAVLVEKIQKNPWPSTPN